MTADEIESLRKIVKRLNDIIAKAENGEDTADTPVVLTAPATAIENKKKLLEDEK